jgi:hypothetical protein
VTSLPAPSRVPPITPLDTSLPKPNGFGREDAPSEELFLDLEKQLFDRGKQVLGKEAGGLIAKLLKAKQRNFALARAAIEMASTKQNAREYVAAVIRGPLPEENGWVWKRGIEGVI